MFGGVGERGNRAGQELTGGRTGSKFVLASAIILYSKCDCCRPRSWEGRGGRKGGRGGGKRPRRSSSTTSLRRSERSSRQIRARIRQWVKGHTTQIAAAALRQARKMLLLQARYKAGSCVPSAGAGRGPSIWWWWWYSTGTSQRPNSALAWTSCCGPLPARDPPIIPRHSLGNLQPRL